MITKILYHPFFIRLFHWEYWPFHVVYGPVYVFWFWLCIRARSLFFFNASNPAIVNGGFLMESKKAIYDLIPPAYYPRTVFCRTGTSADAIIRDINECNLQFPLIAKPDIGMQGKAVKKLLCEKDLTAYACRSKVDFLVQELILYPKECGIFYYRYPGEQRGHISGIVEKEFLAVTGDGILDIEALIRQSKRHILQLKILQDSFGTGLKQVPGPGEQVVLVPYGNHVRGAKFIDNSHLADEQLTRTIDHICQQVPGFFFGRLDLRYHSWEELRQGKKFSIVELNGAGSEPTHIYDPRHSLFFAWKEIIRHWIILYRISRLNHRLYNKPYLRMKAGLEMLRANRRHVKLINDHRLPLSVVKSMPACLLALSYG